MSAHEVKLFEANFNVWKTDRAAGLTESKAFERYVIEQVLKDFDLSNDAIESGDCGAEDDGGVDAVYLFMNKTHIALETPPVVPAGPIELHLIQAKYEKGFAETAVQKLESFAKDLLSYDKSVDDLKYLNSKARDAIRNFRDKYNDEVMGNPHTLSVVFHYGCKAAVRAEVGKLNQICEGGTFVGRCEIYSVDCQAPARNGAKSPGDGCRCARCRVLCHRRWLDRMPHQTKRLCREVAHKC